MSRPLAAQVTEFLSRRARWSPIEIAFWLVAASTIWLFPTRHLILTEICIWALFALSLDLILGYAGIISLGHAAFFGLGAYAAGLIGKYDIIGEPVLALVASGLVAAALGFATSFLVLRGSDLTRLMVTFGISLLLREIANKYLRDHGRRRRAARRGDQAVARSVSVRSLRPHRIRLQPGGSVRAVPARPPHRSARPSACRLQAIRGNPLRSSAVGIATNWRLVAIYTSRPVMPGSRARCSPRPRPSRRSRCSRSSAPPTCS